MATRVYVKAPGKARTYYDRPDNEVAQFKKEMREEFEQLNPDIPCPFTFAEEQLVHKR